MQLRTSGFVLLFISVLTTLNSLTVQADLLSALNMQQDPPIELSTLIEFSSEYQLEQRDEDTEESKVSLATLEVGLYSELSDSMAANVLFAYQEDLDSFITDTMTINLAHQTYPQLYSILGKDYLPFGAFTTFQLNDPFTLEVAESNQLFAGLGYHSDHLVSDVFTYENEEGIIGKMGGRLGFHSDIFQLGIDYIDSLHESPAYGIHGLWSFQQLTLIAEHIVVDHVEFNEKSHSEQFELGYDFDGILVAASYQVNHVLKELEQAKELATEKVSMVIQAQIHKVAHMGFEIWRQDGIANVLAQLSVVL